MKCGKCGSTKTIVMDDSRDSGMATKICYECFWAELKKFSDRKFITDGN